MDHSDKNYLHKTIPTSTNIGNIIMYIISGVLIIAFVVKGVFVWRDYRHNGGEIQWNVLLVLFICLVVVVSAPSWMWSVIGW